MMRGVSFQVIQKTDRILSDILDGINILNYKWYNIESQYEAWSRFGDGEDFLEDAYYQGEDLKACISKNHFIIFLKLEAYLEKTNCFDIHTYEEFQNSECKILLLIYDCTHVEIFAKEEEVIRSIYENAVKKDFIEVEYITDMSDGRVIMDVR